MSRSRALLILPVVAFFAVPAALWAEVPSNISFDATAAGNGVGITLFTGDLTIFSTPVDRAGGPTAQVAVDSLGLSKGYAAYPDPGENIVGVPALASGLGGETGLPIPSTPGYPFYVATDSSTNPEQEIGSGPYRLSASSKEGESEARASAGFVATPTGNTALVVTTGEVGPTSDEEGVAAVGESDVQGFAVGPLTFGRVRTIARMTIDATGTVTPSTSLEITGAQVGGVPVSIVTDGLRVGDAVTPLPLNDTLADLLDDSGVQVRLLPPQHYPNRVVAPAVEVTYPFATEHVQNVGSAKGRAVVVLGQATASMTGDAFEDDVVEEEEEEETEPVVTNEPGEDPFVSDEAVGVGGVALPESPVADFPSSDPGGITRTTRTTGTTGESLALASSLSVLDFRSLYLAIAAGSLACFAVSQLMRRMGARAWMT